MRYPVCRKLVEYEFVARAFQAKVDLEDYPKLLWRLNDGHYANSIDKITPNNVGDLILQRYGHDDKRFLVPVKEAESYTFENSTEYPTPKIVYDYDYLTTKEPVRMLVYYEDSSASLFLTCNDKSIKIEKLDKNLFKVTADYTSVDKVVVFTATAQLLGGSVTQNTNKSFFIASSIPTSADITVPKQGVVNKPITITVPDSNTYLFVDRGYLTRNDNTYTLLSKEAGLVKLICFRVIRGITSSVLEYEVSFFLKAE